MTKFEKTFLVAQILILSLSNCQSRTQNISDGEFKIVGTSVDKSPWNGEVWFYDLKTNALVAKRNYKDDSLHGPSLVYNQHSIMIDSINYNLGTKNGLEVTFNDQGALLQKKRFYFGKRIGEELNFANGTLEEYRFTNFENKILYERIYKNREIDKSSSPDIALASGTVLKFSRNGKKMARIFIYLIKPPDLVLEHLLVKYDSIGNQIDSFPIIGNTIFFEGDFDFSSGQKIVLKIDKKDPVTNKSTVIIDELTNWVE